MWKQYNRGRRWRVLPNGAIEVEGAGQGVLRTSGQPLTMRRLFDEYGELMREAAARFNIPVVWIAGMIPIEALMPAHPAGGRRADPVSIRREPGYVSDAQTPNRISAGLTQTLLSTAQNMARRHGLPVPTNHRELTDPRTSIMLGAAYMANRRDAYAGGVEGQAFDFVHLTGAYNAGRMIRVNWEKANPNPFGMITYGQTRTERAIRWYNDALAVLAERPNFC
jgi:hypothetical protein